MIALLPLLVTHCPFFLVMISLAYGERLAALSLLEREALLYSLKSLSRVDY